MDQGLKALELAVKGTEGGFQTSDPPQEEYRHIEGTRKAVAGDPRMQEIKRAVLIPKFGKTFQAKNPNIPLKDLKADKERFLRQASSKNFPLFGSSVIKAVLQAADEEVGHQGDNDILEFLKVEKYVFYDEDGMALDQEAEVTRYAKGCLDCSEVQKIRNKVSQRTGRLLQIPKKMETEVLLYADRRHQGYAAAYKRVKTWADFPDFKRKVFQILEVLPSGAYIFSNRSKSTLQPA